MICPLCERKKFVEPLRVGDYINCTNCSIAWLKKIPKISYEEDYYTAKSGLASKLFFPVMAFFHLVRRSFAGFGRKRVWIDVGAGAGEFLATVKADWRIGVEISKSARKMMRHSGLVTMTEKQFLASKGLNAGIISYWHVLEHTDKPWEYLAAGKRNLDKSGKIIIGVPNIDSLEFRFFKDKWFHLVPQYHLWHFTPKSLRQIIEKAGFKIDKIDWWSIEHHPTGILQSFLNKTSSSQNVLHKLLKRGEGLSDFPLQDVLWTIFWPTVGLPIVFMFWLISSLFHKSGTIVVVASNAKKSV